MVEHLRKPLNRVFFALSDPTRRAIVLRLAAAELTVTAVAARFAISLAAVSKHIQVLEQAGLVGRTKHGREYRLRLVAEPLRDVVDWAGQFERFWSGQLESIKQVAERKARERTKLKHKPSK